MLKKCTLLVAAVLCTAACTNQEAENESNPDPVTEEDPAENEADDTEPADNDTNESELEEENRTDEEENEPPEEEAENDAESAAYPYAVSAGHPAAVEAGMTVLAEGGNAVDAAVAAAFAVSVVEPFASGIGGGGVALIHEQGEAPESIDYREVVPGDGIPSSNVGVPGFVQGMQDLSDRYGESGWEDLLTPAVELAGGAEVTELLAEQLESGASRLPVSVLPQFYPDGAPLAVGETLVQSDLAAVLEAVRADGAEAFYEGALADDLIENVDGLDAASLAGYETVNHEPVSGSFLDYDVIGAPAPLPGISVVQMLQMLEGSTAFDDYDERYEAEHIHYMAMSWRLARAMMETELGDPNFVDVPVDAMTNPEQNRELAEAIEADQLFSIGENEPYSAPNTTHITVVDRDGTVVSMTNTLTNFWGSALYTNGFFLNDQMARFSIGRSDNNDPEPGRRSITWSAPMIVADEEGPVLGIGSPGGERIPLMLAQVIADWAVHNQDVERAVASPRFHINGDRLILEEPPDEALENELLSIGYAAVEEQPTALYFGSVQALSIDRDDRSVTGYRDERREADVAVEDEDS
ncbi:gamma-glutamyltransferase family protein [Bacillus daqingensis]|uniref:Gamma-glutamyltransferase family protein n=1 Tax=Bacillus daqingensis TaxID=872396 RepID=A0ABV9NTN2_9BACI